MYFPSEGPRETPRPVCARRHTLRDCAPLCLPRRRPAYTVFSAHLLTRPSTNHLVYDHVYASSHSLI
jgi:hypothetical protein